MAFWVYILTCGDGSYYVGHTDNLEQRVAEHKSGDVAGYTASRLPVQLAWSESFGTRIEALTCERQIKGWSRAKKQALIRGDWELIKLLARSRSSARPSTSSGRTEFNPTEPWVDEPVEADPRQTDIQTKRRHDHSTEHRDDDSTHPTR